MVHSTVPNLTTILKTPWPYMAMWYYPIGYELPERFQVEYVGEDGQNIAPL